MTYGKVDSMNTLLGCEPHFLFFDKVDRLLIHHSRFQYLKDWMLWKVTQKYV